MKTTIEIDDEKLEKIMRMSGIGTRKEAVDWALTEGLRIATMNSIEKSAWTVKEAKGAVDEDYDILAIRNAKVTYGTKSKRRARR